MMITSFGVQSSHHARLSELGTKVSTSTKFSGSLSLGELYDEQKQKVLGIFVVSQLSILIAHFETCGH